MTADYTEMMTQFEIPSNPFPGLRPFEFNESLLYFGRDGQSEQLLRRLAAARFMAVIGTSGSGKSSLVRAGLLPALFGGFMASAGSDWRIALFRPSNDPIGNLASAINDSGLFDKQAESLQTTMIEATLRRGNLGLVEAVRQSKIAPHENVLVVVDQFEELFRFAQVAESEQYQNDAAAFVKLLLGAAHQKEIPIYVVITMRSDFLGDCSLFWDLPEAINEGQYLIPRLTREQRREAITGPIAVCGADITPRLVNRLLNDMGDNPDQLPILQHALMRTWNNWKASHQEDEPIDLQHYEAIGGMSAALSLHADEAYNELPDERSRKIAEKIFKGLTEKGADNREIRRPIVLKELCSLTEASEAEVIRVIEVFRREGRSFLMPSAGTRLDSDSLIDISHESLIRNWERLKNWVDDEARSARIYRRLAETAVLHEKGEAGLYRDPDLQLALSWRDESRPNKTWARRYHAEFKTAMDFLDASREARNLEARDREAQRRREIKRTRRTAMIFALAFLLSLAALIFANSKRVEANESKVQLEDALKEAEAQRLIAESALIDSNLQAGIARQERGRAEAKAIALEIKQKELVAAEDYANEKAVIASENAKKAKAAAIKAEQETDRAEAEVEHSRKLLYADTLNLAQNAYYEENIKSAQELLEDDATKHEDLRGFEWNYLNWLYHRETGTLDGKDGGLKVVAFSPDNKYIAQAGEHFVKLRDAATQQELLSIPTSANALAFSPDGKLLAYGGEDSFVRLQKIGSTEAPVVLGKYERPVTSIIFSRDGNTLIASSEITGRRFNEGQIKAWDVALRQERFEIAGLKEGVKMLTLSPDEKTLAAISSTGTLSLFDMDSRKLTYERDYSNIKSVAFSPNSKMIVAATNAGDALRVFDLKTKEELSALEGLFPGSDYPPTNTRSTVVFSPDGKMLAFGSLNTVNLYDAAKLDERVPLKLLTPLLGQQTPLTSLAFAADGKTLVTSDSKSMRFWDTTMPRNSISLGNHDGLVEKAFFSPDSKTVSMLVYSTVRGAEFKMLDVASQQKIDLPAELAKAHEEMNLSADGKHLATFASRKEAISLWDVESRKLTATFSENPAQTANRRKIVLAVTVSPDGKHLAAINQIETSGRAKSVSFDLELWNADSPHEPVTLKSEMDSPLIRTAFSLDGKIFACFGEAVGKGILQLRNVASKETVSLNIKDAHSIDGLVFSPDGRKLIVFCNKFNEHGNIEQGFAELWDIPSLRLMKLITKGHSNLKGLFSQDSNMFAITGDAASGPSVILGNVDNATAPVTLKGYAKSVSCMAFSSDGKLFATGSKDGLAKLWSTSSYRILITLYDDNVEPFSSIAFSPDNRMLVTGGTSGAVRLWPTASSAQQHREQ